MNKDGEIEQFEFKVDADWLRGSLKRHRSLLDENKYLAPLHIKHHGMGVETRQVGMFFPTRVGKLFFDGKEQDTLFADLVEVPEDVFEQIKRNRLPFRSVEIADIKKKEITSTALLDDEAPFFKFPMLTIGNEERLEADPEPVFASEWSGFNFAPRGTEPVLVYSSIGNSYRCLLKFDATKREEQNMAFDQNANGKTEEKEDRLEKFGEALQKISENMEKLTAALMPKEDGSTAPKPAEVPVEQEQSIMLSEAEGTKDAEEAEESVQAVEETSRENEAVANYAELVGRMKAIEQYQEDQREEEKVRSLVERGKKRLEEYHLSGDLEQDLEKLARKGEEAVDAYCDALEKSIRKIPPQTYTEFLGSASEAGAQVEPEAVTKYRQHGPEVYEKAVQKWQEWQQLRASRGRFSVGLEEHLELSVRNGGN